MSWLHLVRHGQAGTRADYDSLSALGEDQGRRLGGHLRTLGTLQALSGGLQRQIQTARLAMGTEPDLDPGWSEFDLDAVYAEVAPRLAEVDAEFAAEYAQLQRDIQNPDHAVHRKWTMGDVKVMQSWIAGRFPVQHTETWNEFEQRIRQAGQRAVARAAREPLVIFTSATPVGITVAALLGLDSGHAMRLAGAKMNSAITSFRIRAGDPTLFTFNSVPHLPDPALHTFR